MLFDKKQYITVPNSVLTCLTKLNAANFMQLMVVDQPKSFFQMGASAAIHIFSLVVGFTHGFSAILLPELDVSEETASWIASLGILAISVGCLLSGPMMDKVGRKTAIQIAFAPFLVGWAMIASTDDVINICIGRTLTGLAVGMGSSRFVYVAEVTRPEDRNFLSLFGAIFMSFGILIVYTLGYIIHWKLTAMFSFCCCIIGVIFLQVLPESPIWLKSVGEEIKAVDAKVWFEGEAEKPLLLDDADESKLLGDHDETVLLGDTRNHDKNYFRSFIITQSWKPFVIMVLFFILQAGCGQYDIVFYAVDLIEKLGSRIEPHKVSIVLATVRSIMSVVGSLLIQKYNRCIMVILSASGMGIIMLLLGLYEYQYENFDMKERPFNFAPQILIILHSIFSMLGAQQLPWILSGELFSLSVRGVMNGIISAIGYILLFFAVKIYPSLLEKLSISGSLLLFSGFSFSTIIFGKYILPETKDKSLQEIEEIFNKKAKSFNKLNKSEDGEKKKLLDYEI